MKRQKGEIMRVISTVLISAIVFFTLNSLIPTKEECEIYDSTVRLHVIANSDSDKDQEVKLKVRDALLKEVGTYEAEGKEEALEKIKDNKARLEKIATDVLCENDFGYVAKIEVGKESYPTRYYDDFALPAGEYTSVRVILGEGKGQNWWCVLYPPLCTGMAVEYEDDAYVDVGLTKDQYELITNDTGKYKVKFKLLEIASEAFGISRDD